MRAKWIVALALLAATARASEEFPDRIELKTGADLPDAPQSCRLCHNNDEGGKATATTRFAQTMIGFGLEEKSRLSLDDALAKFAADPQDSDKDGLDDISELQAGRDPNWPEIVTEDGGVVQSGEAPRSAPPFQTGCAVASVGAQDGGAALALLVGGLVLRRRARKGGWQPL